MKKNELVGVQEMDAREMKEVCGGAWIADLVEKALCSCIWENIQPMGRIYSFL